MIRIIRKEGQDKKKQKLIQLIAIVAAFVFTGIFILLMGYNPFELFAKIAIGSVGSETRILQTIERAVPLIITSMGILVAFKMKFWNIGGEGQIMMGAFGSSIVALYLSPEIPAFIMLTLAMIAGAIGGAIWAFIPAFFKAKFGTNETIFTLMLNYIAIKFVTYLQFGPWRDPEANGFPVIRDFPENAVLPEMFGTHIGWIFAILSIILVYIFINHTKKGYEVTVVGESMETARYAGMNTRAVIMVAMLISGGLCGIAGMIQASGIEQSLSEGISAGIGFTAIITAWLGKLNPPVVGIVCVLFSMLLQGGNYVEISMAVPSAVAGMIQGMILFFVIGGEFFQNYKVSFEKEGLGKIGTKNSKLANGSGKINKKNSEKSKTEGGGK